MPDPQYKIVLHKFYLGQSHILYHIWIKRLRFRFFVCSARAEAFRANIRLVGLEIFRGKHCGMRFAKYLPDGLAFFFFSLFCFVCFFVCQAHTSLGTYPLARLRRRVCLQPIFLSAAVVG